MTEHQSSFEKKTISAASAPGSMGATVSTAVELSVIVPVFNEEAGIPELLKRLFASIEPHFKSFEFVFVDDGSTDRSFDLLENHSARDSRVKVYGLSRNFGKEVALTAGLDHARGEFVVPLDADLQDPPELVFQMVEKAREGFDVVYGVRTARLGESWFKKLSAWCFYQAVRRLSVVDIPANTGDFRVMRAEVIHALLHVREKNRFMKGVLSWVGYKQTPFYYQREPRFTGHTSWNYWKLWNLAVEGITSFSTVPLKFASYAGVLVAFCAFIMAFFYGFKAFIYGDTAQGFPTLIVSVLFLGGIQLFSLGILGEYIGRIYFETKDRPLYFLRKSSASQGLVRPNHMFQKAVNLQNYCSFCGKKSSDQSG